MAATTEISAASEEISQPFLKRLKNVIRSKVTELVKETVETRLNKGTQKKHCIKLNQVS